MRGQCQRNESSIALCLVRHGWSSNFTGLAEHELGGQSAQNLQNLRRAGVNLRPVLLQPLDGRVDYLIGGHQDARIESFLMEKLIIERCPGCRSQQLKHPDAGLFELYPQRLRVGVQTGFTGPINRRERERHQGQTGACIENRGRRLPFEKGQKLLHHPNRTHQINLYLAGNVGKVSLVQAHFPHFARVVNQYIQPGKSRSNLLVQLPDGHRVAYIALDGMNTGQTFFGLLKFSRVSARDNNRIAHGQQPGGPFETKSAGPPRNQDGITRQFHRLVLVNDECQKPVLKDSCHLLARCAAR